MALGGGREGIVINPPAFFPGALWFTQRVGKVLAVRIGKFVTGDNNYAIETRAGRTARGFTASTQMISALHVGHNRVVRNLFRPNHCCRREAKESMAYTSG